MWDRDTLAQELQGIPEIADVIAGRFERNPDLYYEMRIERIESDLSAGKAEPPSVFFDIAVSLDKLGRHTEAIACIEKRLKQYLLNLDWGAGPKDRSNFEYQRWANLGTFYIHRGVKQAEAGLPDIRKGLSFIEKAIEINPGAHFGREVVQVALVEDLIWELEGETGERPALFLSKQELREGLLGIVVLGGAWENPKVWCWIAGTLGYKDANATELIILRIGELGSDFDKYKVKLPQPLYLSPYQVTSKKAVQDEYAALRKSGDAWQKNRTQFMLAKLDRGEHPDTHPEFWNGYTETKKYIVKDTPVSLAQNWLRDEMNKFFVAVGFVMGGVIGFYIWKKRRAKKL